MKALLFCCCEISLLEQRSNSLSLINLFEEFNVAAFPVIVPRISVACLLERTIDEDEKRSLNLSVELDSKSLFKLTLNTDFQGKVRVRTIGEIEGFVLTAPGLLTFKLQDEDVDLGVWFVRINHTGAPTVKSRSEPADANSRDSSAANSQTTDG